MEFRENPEIRSLLELPAKENSLQKYLIAEDVEAKTGDQIYPRQVKGCHFTYVLPEPVRKPELVIASEDCARSLGLNPSEVLTPLFTEIFAGNALIPGLDKPYATLYGCHCYGQWFGQNGDGRATILGEVHYHYNLNDTQYYSNSIQELQLKGAGRTPYSRGFDGRAVLRSSVREFLASEFMFHLGVPTTRALSLVKTGEIVVRPWYRATSENNPYNLRGSASSSDDDDDSVSNEEGIRKFPPDVMIRETGAICCRVSKSFFRFGHFELFASRKEWKELIQLMNFVIYREYPHLIEQYSNQDDQVDLTTLPPTIPEGPPRRYIELFRSITKSVAYLASEWIRVGYVQGNMNSDNTLIGGRTLDYGPFGWMEKFDPNYQPFTSDPVGRFSFMRQPSAMAVNVAVLGETVFIPLLRHLATGDSESLVKEIKNIMEEEFAIYFQEYYEEMRRKKLGLSSFQKDIDESLWFTLLQALHKYECDYTIFFRELSKVSKQVSTSDEAVEIVSSSFYEQYKNVEERTSDLKLWFEQYLIRIKNDSLSNEERRDLMDSTNPKFILRNWMSAMAYERAELDDYSILHELLAVLSHPYDEQSQDVSSKWYQKTPPWAARLPGVAFMSCSS
eukprot:gene6508-7008_t